MMGELIKKENTDRENTDQENGLVSKAFVIHEAWGCDFNPKCHHMLSMVPAALLLKPGS